MPKLMRLICLVLVSFTLSPAQTGKVIHGTIKDAQSGESLPVANIQIEGTYPGATACYPIDQLHRLRFPEIYRYR
jgi:hypothetical protein